MLNKNYPVPARIRHGRPLRLLWLLVVLFLALAHRGVAMAGQVASATECGPGKEFFVVSHGWHTGLVLDGQDLAARLPALRSAIGTSAYVEIGWGDERFYRADTTTSGITLGALFWPTPSVMHMVAFDTSPRRYFAQSTLLQLDVPRAGYVEMLEFVAGSFQQQIGGTVFYLGPGLYGNSGFYQARGKFHALNTCNTWVAEAIEKTGFPMPEERTLTARGLFARIVRGDNVGRKCFTMR